MKIAVIIFLLILLYLGVQVGVFFYKYQHLPTLPTIDQSDKVFGPPGGIPIRYIAAGDSTAVGVGASSLGKTYPFAVAQYLSKTNRVEYKNIAVKGYTTEDILNKQIDAIIAFRPDLVTISMGGNDATHLVSGQDVVLNYKAIINKLETLTQAKICITDVPNFYGAKVLPWFYINLIEYRSKGINKEILALEDSRVKIVDIHNFGWNQYPDRQTTYAADGFHPNDLGYQNWAAAFLEKIQKP